MKTMLKISALIAVVLAVLLAAVVLVGYHYVRQTNYDGGLEVTRTWARLNDFPESATRVTVSTDGGPFTREFTVTFHAPLADINAWLDASPGTSDVAPEISNGNRKFEIEPGGGAVHAELEVDDASETVQINTYWS